MKFKQCTDEEREELWEQFLAVPDKVNRAALSEVYLHVVHYWVVNIHRTLPPNISYLEYEDLFSEGFIGLLKAIDRFDASTGFKFETYAGAKIKSSIMDFIRTNDFVTRHGREIMTHIQRARAALKEIECGSDETGHCVYEPSIEEISHHLQYHLPPKDKPEKYTPDFVRQYSSLYNRSFIDHYDGMNSLDLDEDFISMKDMIPSLDESPESGLEYSELGSVVADRFLLLTEEEQDLFRKLFIEEQSLDQVAKGLGVSKKSVESMIDDAVFRLEKSQ